MKRIKLSNVAKNGVKNPRVVTPFSSEQYLKLVKEADARIEAQKKDSVDVYRRATLYVAR